MFTSDAVDAYGAAGDVRSRSAGAEGAKDPIMKRCGSEKAVNGRGPEVAPARSRLPATNGTGKKKLSGSLKKSAKQTRVILRV